MTDYTLYFGDCLSQMDNVDDNSIDAIIADLPYGSTACSWDTIIPFEPMWKQFKRILKPRGACVLFGSEPFSSMLRVSNLTWYKYDWVWKKGRGSGFFHAQNKPLKYHEIVSVFSSGVTVHESQSDNRMTYNPQMEEGQPYKKFNRVKNVSWGAFGAIRPNWQDTMIINDGERYPSTVIEMDNHNGGSLHPTQKPVALLEYLTLTYTNPGDTILDCTMGSCPTGKAAVKNGRSFIGIDNGYCEKKDSEYYGWSWVVYAHVALDNAAGEFIRTPAEKATGQMSLLLEAG
jgi:site-specific DNA-methyltransferase (adenine-specific)